MNSKQRRLIVSADDFGLTPTVNEGIEQAHRQGLLTATSLMVAAPAAADAVARARANPGLHVGLHLTLVEGPAALAPERIPDLVGPDGRFCPDQLRLALRYQFSTRARRQLAAEIRAQFAAFATTGLKLDHADAHKHMHLHPLVAHLMLRIGREFGLKTVRVPAEPPALLATVGETPTFGARALYHWSQVLRAQVRHAGMLSADRVVGIAWSGHMTIARLLALAPHIPAGTTELYFHPSVASDAALRTLMPDYEHMAELAALCDPRLRAAFADCTLIGGAALI